MGKKIKKSDYDKVVISELGINPFHMLKSSFALMGIIPLLVMFYVLVGRNFFYELFLGSDGLTMAVGVFISLTGYLYAYLLISRLVDKLLAYSAERKRADDEKSAFVANVSHEFKNPLAVIGQSLGLILGGVCGKVNEKQKELLSTGKRNIDRLFRLVTDLLDISKIEAGKMVLREEKVDMTRLTDEVIATYKIEIDKKEITLKSDLPKDIGLIWGDRDKLSEVIINLLNNAIKYSNDKGNITIGLKGTEKDIRFEISDNGPGMPKESIGKIFNKFERITTEKREGTGLGLPITKDIVELHKGNIWAESDLGKGSKFSFILPRDFRK
ncbi:MAG: hypothetical protein ISS26_04655 [Candidatus Omnitrophica bacterium]|nr:hypothetical protein [Candidatus Omnitrophota bacterium]